MKTPPGAACIAANTRPGASSVLLGFNWPGEVLLAASDVVLEQVVATNGDDQHGKNGNRRDHNTSERRADNHGCQLRTLHAATALGVVTAVSIRLIIHSLNRVSDFGQSI